MRVLITGASGLLGKEMYSSFFKRHETIGTYSTNEGKNLEYLDITQADSVRQLFQETRPDVVIHTAALVDVDGCEERREEAYKINVIGTLNVAHACKAFGSKLVYISSDFVFDGVQERHTEESATNPVNFYGHTKLEGEKIVQRNLDDYLIIRPALLYGNGKKNFVRGVLEKLLGGEPFELDNSVTKYPTLIDDVSMAARILIESDSRGIYHVAGQEAITKYMWALKIASAYGMPSDLIQPCESEGKVRRPKNVMMDISKIRGMGFNPLATSIEKGIHILKNQETCALKAIYLSDPEEEFFGTNVALTRVNLGRELAREHPVNADIVVPIPETGKYAAQGYSMESRIPGLEAIRRKREFGMRTLFQDTTYRKEYLDRKLIPLPELIKGKKVVLVDEAIMSGITQKNAVEKVRASDVSEIHIRIPSPPMAYHCHNGVLERDIRLIAKARRDKESIEEELRKQFNVDSLRFISMGGFLRHLNANKRPCVECFYGREL